MQEDQAYSEPVVYDSLYPMISRLLLHAQGHDSYDSPTHLQVPYDVHSLVFLALDHGLERFLQ